MLFVSRRQHVPSELYCESIVYNIDVAQLVLKSNFKTVLQCVASAVSML